MEQYCHIIKEKTKTEKQSRRQKSKVEGSGQEWSAPHEQKQVPHRAWARFGMTKSREATSQGSTELNYGITSNAMPPFLVPPPAAVVPKRFPFNSNGV